jgi:hypothetical protein
MKCKQSNIQVALVVVLQRQFGYLFCSVFNQTAGNETEGGGSIISEK